MTITTITPAAEDLARADDPERANYTALLTDLAGLLRKHPEIPLPYFYTGDVRFNIFGEGATEIIAAIRRAIGGKWDKKSHETESGAYLDFTREWHGHAVTVTTSRDEVCRRVVVGTEERPVEKVITPAVTEMVMEPVEIVRWVCEPVLAPRPLAETAPKAAEAA